MLNIGWIDFSKEHQKRVRDVLNLLKKSGAVDELGIGVLRDRFADRLFPGTSTIQTRAKYFFIVPWIIRNLEKEGFSGEKFANELARREVQMVNVLWKPGVRGIIGAESGEALQRKPSEIYWSGLRAYNIFRYPQMSLGQYLRVAGKAAIRLSGDFQKDPSGEDASISGEDVIGPFWNIPPPPDTWPDQTPIHLTFDEAEFLKERIVTAPGSKDSLWAHLLKSFPGEARDREHFFGLQDLVKEMPPEVQEDYRLANDFARLIRGAHIRYNCIFFKQANLPEMVEVHQEKWEDWALEMRGFPFKNWNVDALFERLAMGSSQAHRSIRAFLKKWTQVAADINGTDLEGLDNYLMQREEILKGRERAKLRNPLDHIRKDTTWIGIEHLDFRWSNIRWLLDDMVQAWGSG